MLKCGVDSGQKLVRACNCKAEIIPLKHRCNLRTCPYCAKSRQRRIRRDYLPVLQRFSLNPRSKDFLYFLTISPEHATSFKEGLDNARKTFQKFQRNKYVKERLKGGFYCIETKNTGKGFHVHIHAICYGRYLDNKIRGKCLDCGQNSIKKNYVNGEYFCANRKCNSKNLYINQDSKIVNIWKKSSKKNVNFNINRLSSHEFALNYMLKYISSNKDDFTEEINMAQYIVETRKQKLITKFGQFFSLKIEKVPCICHECNSRISFVFDLMFISHIEQQQKPPPPSYFPD